MASAEGGWEPARELRPTSLEVSRVGFPEGLQRPLIRVLVQKSVGPLPRANLFLLAVSLSLPPASLLTPDKATEVWEELCQPVHLLLPTIVPEEHVQREMRALSPPGLLS